MFSAMLLAISTIALSQFALYYWRAVLSGVAEQPVSPRVLEAARLDGDRVRGEDFEVLAGLHELTPVLAPGPGGIALVRAYFRILQAVGFLAGSRIPSLSGWSSRERAVCARYTAVQIDRRLQANLALSASLRSC